MRLFPLLILCLAWLCAVSVARAQDAASQFYLLSFEDAPVAEVAEAVVGGALSQAVAVDPAVEGTISFQAEGAFTAQALLEEFGTAALDADLALIRSRAGDLAVMPRTELGRELARGGTLVARAEPSPAAPVVAPDRPARAPIAYGEARWWDGALGGALIFLAGGLSGALVLRGGQIWRRRGRADTVPTPMRLTHQPMSVPDALAGDPDLIIPRFETPPTPARAASRRR